MLFLRVIAWYGAEKFSLKKVVSIFTSGGDMSLVGTRPILPGELEQYEFHHRTRIAIKPGITGMWQVSGRSDITDFEEVVELDKTCLQECALWKSCIGNSNWCGKFRMG